MTFASLKDELARRGFDYLDDDAKGRYINDAYLIDIAEECDWLWLRSEASGPAPLEIADLRSVLIVINQADLLKLTPLKEQMITDSLDTDPATAGDPRHYYFTSPTTLVTYPTSGAEVRVIYTKTPAPLTGSDEPLLPERFHTLICDAAVARAYEDDDEWDAAGVATERFMNRLGVAVQTNNVPQHDRPDDFIVAVWDQ